MNAVTQSTPHTALAPTHAPRSELAAPRPSWVDPGLYPFASHTVSLAAGRTHYLDEGSRGPTVLFVHGTPSWSFEWRHVITALRGTHRCVVPDHLGFGLSEKPPAFAYTPRAHAEQLVRFIDALDLRDITLVVHDFGGPIGLGAALERLERVRSIVVANTWMWPVDDDRDAVRISRFVRGPIGRFLYRRLNFSPRVLVPAMFVQKHRLTPAVRRHYLGPFDTYESRLAPWVLGCELAGSSEYYRTLWERRAALAPLLREIAWAERDRAFGAPHLARWREAFASARVTLAPDAGHFIAEEAPELIVDAVRRATTTH